MSLQGAYEHEEGVKQRWVVVFSEKAFARETKTLEKEIKKENREENAEKGEVHRRYKRVGQRETE